LGRKPEARLAGNTFKDYWSLLEKVGSPPVMMSGLMRLNLKKDPEQKRYLAVTGYVRLEQGVDLYLAATGYGTQY
jgi:hypothetical protein